MSKRLVTFTVLLLGAPVVLLSSANAAIVITELAPGVTSISAPTETFDSQTLGQSSPFVGADGGLYTGFGSVLLGDVSGVASAPYFGPLATDGAGSAPAGKDPTQYLTVGPSNPSASGPGSPETITYSSPRTLFGLYWGSVDTYNTIDFYLGGVLIAGGNITGSDVIPGLSASGNQTDYSANRYVVFTNLVYDQVVLGSSAQFALEVDNIASGVPELSTWAMMLLGFCGLGLLYGRTKKGSPAVATA